MFNGFKIVIEENDLVMLFLSRSSIIPTLVKKDQITNNKFGSYHHNDMIGLPFGSQLASRTKNGFIFLLHPTPELWTLALPHRTQILYAPDISYISGKLRIRPGSTVIEAGTGSGSFTHSFARSIGKESGGHIYTFEFHQKRCETARLEFVSHGLCSEPPQHDDLVTITHRNVCQDGFKIDMSSVKEGTVTSTTEPRQYAVDAIFLDLPAPWEALSHLDPHLHPHSITRLCSFSPCIEQVQKTVEYLRKLGWLEITCFEIAGREWESRYIERKDISAAVERIVEVRRRRLAGERKEDKSMNGGNRKVREGELGRGIDWLEVGKSESEVKSHTSFLVFAIKFTDDTVFD